MRKEPKETYVAGKADHPVRMGFVGNLERHKSGRSGHIAAHRQPVAAEHIGPVPVLLAGTRWAVIAGRPSDEASC